MADVDRIIILKTVKYGEADLVITGINTGGAKMSFIAKSALRSRKRFGGGVLEPTHFIEAHYKDQSAKGKDLHVLNDAVLLNDFADIRNDYARLELALYLLQLVSQMSQEGVNDAPELYNLLGNALRYLGKSHNIKQLRLQFELKLLLIQGVLPAELANKEFLKRPIRDHEQIEVPPDLVRQLCSRTHNVLHQYLD